MEKTGEGTCKITWGCEFETQPETKDEMVKLFEGFYHTIIESLENLINNQN